jgi:threonine dehydrogenase-like Zn-dependent dehydrogenase
MSIKSNFHSIQGTSISNNGRIYASWFGHEFAGTVVEIGDESADQGWPKGWWSCGSTANNTLFPVSVV